jgi:phosphoglycolate phosphatase
LSRYELLIFDWDGTIMDSTGLIARCIQDACRELELPVPSDADARWVIGLGASASVKFVAPTLEPHRHSEFAALYRGHYLAREHEAPLFEGIPALLAQLRSREHRLAVATGKSRRGLDRALDASGLRPHFEASRCADEGFAKPHPGMLLALLEATGVDPSRALMIGDTTHDLELAANAGVDAVAVTYGAHDAPLLREGQALHLAPSVEDLGQWLALNA